MQRSTITAVLVTSFVFTGLTGFVSSATQDTGTQIQLCVNNRTKAVTYSKSWSKCPSGSTAVKVGQIGPQGFPGAQGPQGVMGPSGPGGSRGPSGSDGSSVSVWNSLDDCVHKLNVALAAGYLMAVKRDRDSFESKTGCTVETTKSSQQIAVYDRMNFPTISDWEFISFAGVTEGDCAYSNDLCYVGIGWATYDLTVSDLPGDFEFCTIDSDDQNKLTNSQYLETTDDGKARIRTSLRANQTSLTAQLEVGVSQNPDIGCNALQDVEQTVVFVNEDPARFIGTMHFQDHLAWWGWR